MFWLFFTLIIQNWLVVLCGAGPNKDEKVIWSKDDLDGKQVKRKKKLEMWSYICLRVRALDFLVFSVWYPVMLCYAAMEVRVLYSLVNLVYKLTHDIKQRQAAKIIHTDFHGIAWYFPQFHKSPPSFFANSLLCLLFPSFLHVFSSVWPPLLYLSHLRPPTLILCTSLKNCFSILPGRIYFTLYSLYIYISLFLENLT